MKLFALLSLSLLCLHANAVSVQSYLSHRRAFKIQSPISASVLDSFVGAKVCEVQGTFKGTFKADYAYILLIQRPVGPDVSVEADSLPDWLQSNEVPVRLIVRATREEESAPLKLKLLDVATESQLESIPEMHSRTVVKAAVKSGPPAARHAVKPKREWIVPESQVAPMYASFIHRQNPRLANAEAMRIAKGVIGFSRHYAIDARLIMAILMVESGFDPMSTSRSGAMGLGQLMPGTANWMGVSNAYDSMESIYGCVKLIRHHLEEYSGSGQDPIVLALAAYNAGEGAVRRHGGVPPYRETQAYVRRVTQIFHALCGGR